MGFGSVFPGTSIQKLTDVKVEDVGSQSRALAEKTAMVRAARQLLSAITKVLILADKVVVKELVAAKDQVMDSIISVWDGVCIIFCSMLFFF